MSDIRPTRRSFLLGGLAATAVQALPKRAKAAAPSRPSTPPAATKIDPRQVIIELYDTVGQIYDQSTGMLCSGSAVLLDERGTIAFCAHEAAEGDQLTIRFARHGGGFTDLVAVEPVWSDDGIDVAFGRIPAASVKAWGLRPTRRGTPVADDTLVAVGFPGNTDRLSLSRIDLNGNEGPVVTVDSDGKGAPDTKSCNEWFEGTIYEGESGGGVHSLKTGAFQGLLKATSALSLETISYTGLVINPVRKAIGAFTPASAIWAIYDRLPSVHAKPNATRPTALPREDCMPSRRNVLSLR